MRSSSAVRVALTAIATLAAITGCSSGGDATTMPDSSSGAASGGPSTSGGPTSSSGGTWGASATTPINPQDGPPAGNPGANAPVPPEGQAEDISTPTSVVGT